VNIHADVFRSVHCDRSFRLERPTLKTYLKGGTLS